MTVRLFDLWSSGMPLAAAALTSAAGQLWQKDHGELRAAYDRLRTEPQSPLLDRAGTLQALQALAVETETLAARLDDLRSQLRRRLVRGQVAAIGFAGDPVSRCEQMVLVPPETWRNEAAIDWQHATVADGRGRVIRDVRIAVAAAPVILGDGEVEA